MADISDVNTNEIKSLYESLENLSCESLQWACGQETNLNQLVS